MSKQKKIPVPADFPASENFDEIVKYQRRADSNALAFLYKTAPEWLAPIVGAILDERNVARPRRDYAAYKMSQVRTLLGVGR